MKSNKISPIDFHLVPVDPDPDFDPKHNQEVIDFTIKEQDRLWRKKQREFQDRIKERSEAISTYTEAIKMGQSESSLERFFGKQTLMHLKGQDMIDRLKQQKKLDPNGSVMKRINNFYAETKKKRSS